MKIFAFSVCLASVASALPPGMEAPPPYVPLQVHQTQPARFPPAMQDVGLYTGEATIAVAIDRDGRLSDCLAVRYSHPAFADAAVEAVRHWSYGPALIRGRPESATADINFYFKSRGTVVVDLTPIMYADLVHFRVAPNAMAYSARSLRELDRIPVPVSIVKPGNPHHRQTARVRVSFYIDESGRVRMAAASSDATLNNNDLTAEAVTAVEQWRFEPPLYHGRPTIAFVEQDFNFRPARSGASSSRSR